VEVIAFLSHHSKKIRKERLVSYVRKCQHLK
jgi:hypothetical protein